jgi:hypothetical protein
MFLFFVFLFPLYRFIGGFLIPCTDNPALRQQFHNMNNQANGQQANILLIPEAPQNTGAPKTDHPKWENTLILKKSVPQAEPEQVWEYGSMGRGVSEGTNKPPIANRHRQLGHR